MGDSVIPVKVATRIRPLSQMETDNGCLDLVDIVPGRPQIVIRSLDKAFTFDYAFGQVLGSLPRVLNFLTGHHLSSLRTSGWLSGCPISCSRPCSSLPLIPA